MGTASRNARQTELKTISARPLSTSRRPMNNGVPSLPPSELLLWALPPSRPASSSIPPEDTNFRRATHLITQISCLEWWSQVKSTLSACLPTCQPMNQFNQETNNNNET